MARYLLIEFDNDAQCDALVEKLSDKSTMRVRGMFQKPRSFCTCPPMTDTQQAGQITRGQLFGWWVHRGCKKAHGRNQSPRNLLYDGHPRDNPAYLHTKDGEPSHPYPIGILA